jgi:hypothetical protein
MPNGNQIEHYGDLDLEMSRKKMSQEGLINSLWLETPLCFPGN